MSPLMLLISVCELGRRVTVAGYYCREKFQRL